MTRLDRTGTVTGLQDMLGDVAADPDTSGIMILACDANKFTPVQVDGTLKQCEKPVFGGIFPRILFNKEILEHGTIVTGIRQPIRTAVIGDISNPTTNLEALVECCFDLRSLDNKTMFTFVDGLSTNISSLIESIFNNWGLLPNYIGGGAGSLSFRKSPCIFTNAGLLADAASFALVDTRSGVGVAHGWEPVGGPLKVTEADHNMLISLNLRPAYEVYAETVEKVSGKSFDNTEFFELAKGFPFGILKMSDEVVVRDPILHEGGKLVCVGEIPPNSFVYVLKGDKESLIAGAIKARRLAETTYAETVRTRADRRPVTFIADCISRVLFLGPAFKQELEAVYTGEPFLGALTIGEIANTGKSYLEFYNKTSVVALLEA